MKINSAVVVEIFVQGALVVMLQENIADEESAAPLLIK